MSESAEQKYNRLQSEIQQAILTNFPNPERKGCPGDPAIRELAEHRERITDADEVDEHSVWYHVTHCSPCYAVFLGVLEAERARRSDRLRVTRRTALAVGGAGFAAVALVVWNHGRVRPVVLNLADYEGFRSQGGGTGKKLELPTGRLRVTLELSGPPAEKYAVELRQMTEGDLVFERAVLPTIVGGLPQLTFEIELQVQPGVYTLAVRDDRHETRRYYPVFVG